MNCPACKQKLKYDRPLKIYSCYNKKCPAREKLSKTYSAVIGGTKEEMERMKKWKSTKQEKP